MNRGLCNQCGKLVKAETQFRDGLVYLAKECPDCGTTETLVSSDAERYANKRHMDLGSDQKGCGLTCTKCGVARKPDVIFIDITNRCNLNCPICINNTPGMGFLFEPPMEYFEKIFEALAKRNPPPYVYLFGGEPTVRADLPDIIKRCKKHGLQARLVTNGVRFANEEYAKKILDVRRGMAFHLAYDGDNPNLYETLRGNKKMLDMKVQGIDNIGRLSQQRAKVILMSLFAKGFNDDHMERLIQFAHDRRDFVRGIFFIPLAHTWKEGALDVDPERTTAEDIENAVARAYPDVPMQFVPAGLISQFKAICRNLNIKPQFFSGVHPNCESMYIFFSDGEKYQPLEHFVRGKLTDFVDALFEAEKQMAAREKARMEGGYGRFLAKIGLRRYALRLYAMRQVFRVSRRHMRVGRMFKGSALTKPWHVLALMAKFLVGVRTPNIMKRHTNVQSELHIVVLPFEDRQTLETDRLDRCASSFAYYDPNEDKVKLVCVCAWSHTKKTPIMEKISEHYGQTSVKPDHPIDIEPDPLDGRAPEKCNVGACDQAPKE